MFPTHETFILSEIKTPGNWVETSDCTTSRHSHLTLSATTPLRYSNLHSKIVLSLIIHAFLYPSRNIRYKKIIINYYNNLYKTWYKQNTIDILQSILDKWRPRNWIWSYNISTSSMEIMVMPIDNIMVIGRVLDYIIVNLSMKGKWVKKSIWKLRTKSHRERTILNRCIGL